MTIEEAIQHCKDEAAKLRKDSAKRLQIGLMHAANDCEECAAEHEQLAEWLTELKQRREAEIAEPHKTNADRIRQMTDEELVMTFDTDCTRCAKSENCKLYGDPVSYGICVKGNIEWLKQEVKTDDER